MARAEQRPRLLPPMTRAAAEEWLVEPWVPAGAASAIEIMLQAARLRVPVALQVAAGVGRHRVARALAALAGIATPVVVWDGDGAPPDAAVVLYEPPAWDEAHRLACAALADDGGAWVLAGVAPDETPPPCTAATFAVPSLASRPAAVVPLAERHLRRLCDRVPQDAPRLSADACARLTAHRWPGDVDELERVLTRALLAAPAEIDAEDLAFDAGEPAATPAPVPAALPAPDAAQIELLLAEMAHEIRNPLVTIKTFAGHLPSLLEDEPLRERFRQLTDEGIARIEASLDNLLAYGRLGPPAAQAVDVPPLLDRVLGEVAAELEERHIAVARTGADHGACAADPEHLEFALRNLVAGVAREMPDGESLALDASANGVVRLRFAAGGTTATRLRALATDDGGEALRDPTLLPLPFTLARAVLARNGGDLGVTPEDGGATTVVVRLPVAAATS